jgi:hypothetical protein
VNIYDLLRFLILTADIKVHTPETLKAFKEFRAASLDLIRKLEKTQALGTLTSETEGEINVYMPYVRQMRNHLQ